jgi:hypothetical protein
MPFIGLFGQVNIFDAEIFEFIFFGHLTSNCGNAIYQRVDGLAWRHWNVCLKKGHLSSAEHPVVIE